jgi:hypothetical protein
VFGDLVVSQSRVSTLHMQAGMCLRVQLRGAHGEAG